MTKGLGFIVAVALMAAPSASAQQQTTPPPRFERAVKPGAAGANRLPVDSTLLVGGAPFAPSSRGGPGDLRLVDAAGRDVPYLFVWPTEDPPVWRGGRTIPVTPGKDTSGFEVDIGSVATIDRMELSSLPERFLKRVRLEGSGDRVRWTLLVADGALFNLPSEGGAASLRQAQLAFAPGAYRYLRLIADDHAGPRLLTPASVRVRIAPLGVGTIDTMRLALAFEKRASGARSSRYHVRLPATRLPIVAIELDVANPQVLRAARVTEPQLGAGRVVPVPLGGATLRRASADGATASDLRIPVSGVAGAELDIVIDDLDNQPLDVQGIRGLVAPLPYIFFQSPNGAGIKATYGVDRRAPVAAPQYDIEALRDSVKRIESAAATWGAPTETRPSPPVAAPNALYAAPGAPLEMEGFGYVRAIAAGAGLTAVRLDAAVLAHSRLDDVRIVDAEGRQVPYLVEVLGEPTTLELPPLETSQSQRTGWTTYRLRLPFAGLPDASLRLSTETRVFKREISVVIRELPRDASSAHNLDRTASASWTHDDPDVPAPSVDIPLGDRVRTDSLMVSIDDGDNQKLAISGATLLLPSYRLRFFRQDGASLRLVYGRADMRAPTYDIALIAPRLLDAAAEEVIAEPERTNASAFGGTPKLVFWGVLGAVVLVLLTLIARLVRSAPPPNAGTS